MNAEQRKERPPTPQEVQAEAMVSIADDLGALRRIMQERRDQERPERLRAYPRPEPLLSSDDPRLRYLAFLKAIPGFMQQFQRVPEAYWDREFETLEGEEVELAVVRCPCGSENIVEVTHECAGKLRSGEPCKRYYLFLGTLYVTGGPKARLAPWERIAVEHAQRRTPASS